MRSTCIAATSSKAAGRSVMVLSNVRDQRRRGVAWDWALYAERRPLERVVRPRFTTLRNSSLICV